MKTIGSQKQSSTSEQMIWNDSCRRQCDLQYFAEHNVFCCMTAAISDARERAMVAFRNEVGFHFTSCNSIEVIVD